MLDPLVRWGLGRLGSAERVRLNRSSVLAGAACFGFGMWFVEFLRDKLLIEEVATRLFNAPVPACCKFVGSRLFQNLDFIAYSVTALGDAMPFVILLFPLATLAIATAWRSAGRCRLSHWP